MEEPLAEGSRSWLCRVVAVGIVLVGGIGLGVWGERQDIPSRLHHVVYGASSEVRADVLPDSSVGRLRLFVLAGQSNMSGRGRVDVQARTPVPGGYVFGNDYRWRVLREPVDDTTRQVDPVSKDAAVGVSPARAFAKVVRAARPNEAVGVIPCAKGGSSMQEWQPSLRENTLYGACLKRVRAAGVVGDVAGVLFFQGETDALTPSDSSRAHVAERWGPAFERFVVRWRQDLDVPDLPVVFAQIGSLGADSSKFQNWRAIQQQQARVSGPNVQMIRTRGLPLRDELHYTTEGYRVIGRRFADAWLAMTERPNASVTERPGPGWRPSTRSQGASAR